MLLELCILSVLFILPLNAGPDIQQIFTASIRAYQDTTCGGGAPILGYDPSNVGNGVRA